MEANAVQMCAYLSCSRSVLCTTKNASCCAYILKKTLYFLDAFFREHQIPYVIVFGTLLGAVRNQTIIPWTNDIDIALFDKNVLYSQEIRNKLKQHGYHLFEVIT
jgi:hypothetical protein